MLTPQGFTDVSTDQATPTNNQLMPHSIEAEQALLGALVLDPGQMLDCSYLDRADFYLLNNGLLFEAMKTLFTRHSGYDWVTVTEYLRSAGHLEDIGGEVAVTNLINVTPTSYGAPEYADIVYRHSISRQTIQVALSVTREAYKNIATRSGADLVNEAIDRLANIDAAKNVSNGPQPISTGVNRLFDRMESIEQNGSMAGLPTGLKDLDKLLGGLQDNKFYLLAGRPGMGKSGLALQIAYNISKRGIPVLIFALEMSADDIGARLVSSVSGVPYESFSRPGVSQWGKVINAGDQVAKLPLIVDCTPGLTVSQMRNIAQKTMLKYPVGLIIIDHAGIVKPERRTGNQYQDQSQNADALMALSKQLGKPILSLLQLSRSLESAHDKRPKMHHLRDSGKWEEDADSILFLYRDEVYNPDTEFPNLGEVIIGKNRGGSTGYFSVYADVARNRYRDLEIRSSPLDY